MARLGKKDAEQVANNLADVLEQMSLAAIKTQATNNVDDVSSVNEVVHDQFNKDAAKQLRPLLAEAQQLARSAPTVGDQGAGDGNLHKDFLNKLAERGFAGRGDLTGESLVVQIDAGEDVGDTLDVVLLSRADE